MRNGEIYLTEKRGDVRAEESIKGCDENNRN
ncbi:hypothetical protein LCGC14_2775860 [marine sediment metagenome]|uniref:Uncharacterized protein n=1 Tax=marine sediment metagenome TaxID=412755 RepID=A0A0F9BLA2_9ZZZZ